MGGNRRTRVISYRMLNNINKEGNEIIMNSITINGKTITCSGNNVVINNGRVIVDGNVISECNTGNVKVVIEGDINKIDCDGSVEVHGNSGSVECGGSCKVGGNVKGNIDAGGSVTCENVAGSIDAGGTVKCRNNVNMDKIMEQYKIQQHGKIYTV